MRDTAHASTRRIAPTDAAAHQDNRGWYSKLSRHSRFGLFVKQTRRNAPFIVASPCQSGIKRTLKRAGSQPKTASSQGFRTTRDRPFDADGERSVSRTMPVWFRNGAHLPARPFHRKIRHQSKIYTESNDSDFSPIFGDLTSMQTLAIYRRLLVRGLIA
jgi:hypothetical protein